MNTPHPKLWPSLIGGLCLVTTVAQAAEAPGTMLDQKRLLAERLMQSRSGAVIDQARAALAEAQAAVAAGAVVRAEGLVDQAMRLAASAPPPPPSADSEQQRYRRLLEQVGQYRGEIDASTRSGGGAGKHLDQQRLDVLLARAGGAARAGKPGEAIKLLEQALVLIESAIIKARDGQTVVHALAFASKEEEYRYELNRHRSYVLLVSQAMAEEGRAPAEQQRVAQYTTEAGGLRGKAETLASAKDHAAAVARMEQATRALIRALQVMGFAIPE